MLACLVDVQTLLAERIHIRRYFHTIKLDCELLSFVSQFQSKREETMRF